MLPVPSNRLRSVLRPGPGRGSGVGVCRGDVIEPGARCGGRRSSLQLTDSVNRANPGGPRCAERERAVVSMSRLLLFVIVRLLSVARLSLGDPRRPAYVLDKGNLRNCRGGTNYCSSAIEGDGVLLECTADGFTGPAARRAEPDPQRDRLARPDIAASRETTDGEACWTGSTPKPLSSAARRLASAWIPGVDEESLRKLCSYFSGSPKGFKSIAQCVNSARHLLTSMGENTAEYMFYTLNTIRMCAAAQRMFGPAVVKPFFRAERPRAQSGCGLETSEPLWAGAEIPSQSREDHDPLGANDKYRIFAFSWCATAWTSGFWEATEAGEVLKRVATARAGVRGG
ncbi:hypothetical protein Q5P01_000800 [Channa striata]|uniref:Uncharacterized protein n=1 Tax=Channa striata TaxID=64152 RepID=A0AA88LFM1_CHASR|nr:hypothetical protein Q5P01_000800 [Channa striata]